MCTKLRCDIILTYDYTILYFHFLLFVAVTIKKTAGVTKFKLRLSKYLYTLVVDDKNKATKIEQSFPPSLKAIVVGNKDEESEE